MTKTLVVGDMHLKQRLILGLVDDAVRSSGASRVVFTGDYTDEWRCSDLDEIAALDYQIEWTTSRRSEGLRIDSLMGNHDWHYLMALPAHYTHARVLAEVAERLLALDLSVAAAVGPFLVTHAGLTQSWSDLRGVPLTDPRSAATYLNAMAGDDAGMRALFDVGPARGGSSVPGPLWADLDELTTDPASGLNQIVGHTPVSTCEAFSFDGPSGATTLFGVDTFSLTRSMTPIGDFSMLLVDETTGALDIVWGNPEPADGKESDRSWST